MSKVERQKLSMISQIRGLLDRVERIGNAEIPGTPRIGGRVSYVPLPGSTVKARNILSPRALQVYRAIAKQKRATSRDLQKAMRVNRNVIAGALAEMRAAGLVKSESVTA